MSAKFVDIAAIFYCTGDDGLVHYRYVSARAWCYTRVRVKVATITQTPTAVTCLWCVSEEARVAARSR